jgi:hypothetical protein
MKNWSPILLLLALLLAASSILAQSPHPTRAFNSPYTGEYLQRIAFPIGGIGAGMFCLEGTGAISHLSIRHHPDLFPRRRSPLDRRMATTPPTLIMIEAGKSIASRPILSLSLGGKSDASSLYK